MTQNALSQSSAGFLNNLYLWNKSTKKSDFLYINTDSWKLKANWKILGRTWSKTGVGVSLKLGVSQEAVDGINFFFVCWYKFRIAESFFNNFWVVVVKNGHSFLGFGTLKSAVSQEWIDEMSWVFAYWYKFRKAKS